MPHDIFQFLLIIKQVALLSPTLLPFFVLPPLSPCFEVESHYVAQQIVNFVVFLLLLYKCWGHKQELWHLLSCLLFQYLNL